MGHLQIGTNAASGQVGPLARSHRPSLTTGALIALWMVALFGGMAGLWRYKLTPGTPSQVPLRGLWPAQSLLAMHPTMPTLVMFAHPQCVCTRASLAELRTLTSRFGSRILTTVAFVRPKDAPQEFTNSESWALAASIPGVRVLGDPEGREAALFGASTSGHVVLYSADGRSLFAGGITPARGHIGASPQMDRLVGLLESETGRAPQTNPASASNSSPNLGPGAVYGCPLEERLP